jgi:streptomycin 6-kinase
VSLPAHFERNIHEVFPDRGQAWLAQLPERIAQFERRWSLQVQPPFANLSYNYVAPARRTDASQAVLKLGVPNAELLTEIEALRLYDGQGIARLLEADPAQGALLVERLLPGTPLTAVGDDDEATAIAAHVMRQLWRPLPPQHAFPSVAGWAGGLERMRARYDGSTGPLPAGLVTHAERLFHDLLASSGAPVLLHGDLHQDNILAAQRKPWLAIDPKGVAGEPAYEVGALMRNPRPLPAPILARRASILGEVLGIDRARILEWSFAQAVLSAWWNVEDHGRGWEGAIYVAEQVALLL